MQVNADVQPDQLDPVEGGAFRFHRAAPGYAPSQIVRLPKASRDLSLRVFAKLEVERFGVPSFKGLGTSWAVHRLLHEEKIAKRAVTELVAATEGNFGLAVAAAARTHGLRARIYATAGIHASRAHAIRALGAELSLVNADYDSVVDRARASCDDGSHWVSDTATDPSEAFPQWVQRGYSTIAWELIEQLKRRTGRLPDAVFVPVGVGGLAAAIAETLRPRGVRVVGVEPLGADAAVSSLENARRVPATGDSSSIMQGLNCRELSAVAWPSVRDGMDMCVALTDMPVVRAQRTLASAGIATGPAGSAAFAGLVELSSRAPERLHSLGVATHSNVVVLVTESLDSLTNTARSDSRKETLDDTPRR